MKQYTVIGLGRFGKALAQGLYQLENEVIVIDIDEDNVNALEEFSTHGLIGDSTHEDILKAGGVKEADAVIIGVTDFQTSIMTCLICKELGAKKIIAKARDEVHSKILAKLGVNKIIIPERESGFKLAHNLVYGDAMDMLQLGSDYEVVEVEAPQKWLGKTLAQLDVRNKYGITILGIKRNGEFIGNPTAYTDIKLDDTIIILGKVDDISKLKND